MRSFDGYSPLHLAAASGHCEIASLLLAHGACPDAICDSSTEEIKTAADLAQTDEVIFTKKYFDYDILRASK